MTATATATVTRTAPAKRKGRAVTDADKAALLAEQAKTVKSLQGAWTVADADESSALSAWEVATRNLNNTAVVKARIAYAASMVLPFKGESSLTSLVKVVHAVDFATDKWTKKQVDDKKNTLRPYWEAGKALADKGWHLRTTTPDQDERDLVMKAIRDAGRKKKDDAPAPAENEPGNNGGQDTDPAGDDVALSYNDLLGHLARMNATLDAMIKSDIVVSEQEAGKMSEMLNEFQLKLSGYAADK